MKKGVIKAITFYFVGILVTVLSYLVFDHSYAHGLSPYHVVALFTFVGGVFWMVRVIFKFLLNEGSEERKGIILTNLVVLISTFLIFYITVIRPSNEANSEDTFEDKLTTSVNGDRTTIDINGRIIYLKVKDSVYLDFTDSIK